jgi:hypothetical protein
LPVWFRPVFAGLCLAALALLIVSIFDTRVAFSAAGRCNSGDLFNYYYAARGAVDGVDPYLREAILAHSGKDIHFLYPIYALPVFLPLIAFDFDTARVIYALLQLAAVIGMGWIACRLLPVERWALLLFLLVGFGAVLLRDLCSANTVIFEALLLWLAIAALWRLRAERFLVWLFLAALPKLLWLALAPLLLHRAVNGWRTLLKGALIGAALLGLWLAVAPQTVLHWLINVRATTHFRLNVFTAARWIDEASGGAIGGPLLGRWETWVYAAWIALVVGVLVVALRRGIGLRTLSLFAPLSLLAVWPGNSAYSWVPLLPVAVTVIFFLAQSGRPGAAAALTFLCVLPQQLFLLSGIGFAYQHTVMGTVLVLWLALAALVLGRPQALETWLQGKLLH